MSDRPTHIITSQSRMSVRRLAPAKDRLWVNDGRTVVVRIWASGQVEVATREHTWETWGPPVYLAEEKP